MSFNQDVRFSDSVNPNNPHNLFEWIKPSRTIVDSGVPAASLGEDEWLYIDTSTAIEWIKQNGVWSPLVNFSSIVVPADPLVLNSIHVNEIQTDNSGAVQVNLNATDIFNVGPSTDLTAVQIQASGVISSNALAGTSSLSLGSAGNQLVMDPSINTVSGSPNLNLSASNNVVVSANAGSITAQCATTMDVSAPSGMTVFTNSSGTFFNDGLGTILKVLPNSIDLDGADNLAISSDNAISLASDAGNCSISSTGGDVNVTSTAAINITSGGASQVVITSGGGAVIVQPSALVVDTIFSGTTIGIAATTGLTESGSTVSISSSVGNVTLNAASDINMIAGGTITSSAPFYSGSGTSGSPIYSFSADSNSGLFSAGADAVAIAAGGGSVMNFDTAQVTPNVVVRVNTDGTAASPAYSWNADTDVGFYRVGANTMGVSTNGVVRKTLDTTTENESVHLIPTASNVYDLGSAGLPWRNIYSNNLLNVISDSRVKRDVEKCQLGLNFIESLDTIAYRLNSDADDSKLHFGMIAQDVRESMISHAYEPNNYDMVNCNDDVYSIKYDAVIMPMINAVKEMSEKIRVFEERIRFLESNK